ncbi:DUF6447 family protein [Labrenzia sp. PHM005]|uniref:DUF6447 family protein n=1 Tax=Labrenzia sp. PHM005 TaxID=2590016 RepID=UPI0011406A2B|nr:DUF6447 family protein [Labrenzia sp. PHM005]QDG74943.1 hypothetical protein FJ695_03160 [Labrenzia sp. PHM005]
MTEAQGNITIDGREYAISDLSQDALNQLSSMTTVDRKIAELQQQIAIYQTARNAYAQALAAALPKD